MSKSETYPFTLPDGTNILVGPLERPDYDELNSWIKKQYLSNVRDACVGLEDDLKVELRLAALQHAASLSFQSKDGMDILMGSMYGMARLAYQLIDNPPMDFYEFYRGLFPSDFIDTSGFECLVMLMDAAYPEAEIAPTDFKESDSDTTE